jgi:hypothetical protein
VTHGHTPTASQIFVACQQYNQQCGAVFIQGSSGGILAADREKVYSIGLAPFSCMFHEFNNI